MAKDSKYMVSCEKEDNIKEEYLHPSVYTSYYNGLYCL